MVFVCRKIYTKDMEENDFTDKSLLKFYESDPFHKAFTGEIVSVYQKSEWKIPAHLPAGIFLLTNNKTNGKILIN